LTPFTITQFFHAIEEKVAVLPRILKPVHSALYKRLPTRQLQVRRVLGRGDVRLLHLRSNEHEPGELRAAQEERASHAPWMKPMAVTDSEAVGNPDENLELGEMTVNSE